jgi:hypothetical protein
LGLAAIWVLVAVCGGYLIVRVLDLGINDLACQDDPKHRLLPDYALLAWSVAAVVAGRFLGPLLHPVPENERAEQVADTVGILAAMAFFAAVMFALIYEGIGVQASRDHNQPIGNFHQLEPITYYVRCAIFYDKSGTPSFGLWTYIIFALTGFLAGHWLWPYNPPGRDTEAVGDEPQLHLGPRQLVWPTVLTLAAVVVVAVAGFSFLSFALAANPNTAVALNPNAAVVVNPAAQADVVAHTEGTFRTGILIVVVFVTIFFLVIASLDFVFALKRWDSIGLRVQRWARANVWFAFGLLGVLGALVAHFGGNEIQYS